MFLSLRINRLHYIASYLVNSLHRSRCDLLVNEWGNFVQALLNLADQLIVPKPWRHPGQSFLEVFQEIGLIQQISAVGRVTLAHN